tara:strand:+ start:2148 stop:3401 length:1254 start_codon:yes stop_codon:yes gene_type:complete
MIRVGTLPIAVLFSFLIGFLLGEDSLGGGKNDYLYHEKYFLSFAENFLYTFQNYGMDQINSNVRNSPLFYMIFSFFLKVGFDINHLKYLNMFIIFPLIFYFIKCIDTKYKEISLNIKLCFLSILLLSPTVRTLLIWPYPFLWALTFFVMSLYYYLKFENTVKKSENVKTAYLNVFFLALSAYFTPNFSVFAIYFFYRYFLVYSLSKKIFSIFLLNVLLALPAIYFLVVKDFYLFNSSVYEIDTSTKFNLSNKIIIITTIIFLFFLPISPTLQKIRYLLYKEKFLKIKFFAILIFALFNIFYFNFLKNAGGGIFFHLSNTLFDNYILVYIVFFVSLIFFYLLNLYNFNNILIFILFILYNMQFSIYYKYFDPLIMFIILFLIKFANEYKIELRKIYKKYLIFYILFLGLNLAKIYISY